MMHANLMVLNQSLLPIEVLHCRNTDFTLFCSCDLDLKPTTFMYEQGFTKSYCIRYRQTDIQMPPKLLTCRLRVRIIFRGYNCIEIGRYCRNTAQATILITRMVLTFFFLSEQIDPLKTDETGLKTISSN